jgi:hypothetical protein
MQNSKKKEVETVEPEDVSFFICQLAFGLIQGMISPEDIYEGMIIANCGDRNVARYIRDRAVEEASLYRISLKEELN